MAMFFFSILFIIIPPIYSHSTVSAAATKKQPLKAEIIFILLCYIITAFLLFCKQDDVLLKVISYFFRFCLSFASASDIIENTKKVQEVYDGALL